MVDEVRPLHVGSPETAIGGPDGRIVIPARPPADLRGWPDGFRPGPGDRFPHPVKVVSVSNGEDCPDCGEPTFVVRDGLTGRTGPMCRMCINAIRRQSLQHHQYTDEICWGCEISLDSLGIITAATHHTKPLEDQLQSDGSTRLGIGPLLRDERIDLTDGVLTVLPEA